MTKELVVASIDGALGTISLSGIRMAVVYSPYDSEVGQQFSQYLREHGVSTWDMRSLANIPENEWAREAFQAMREAHFIHVLLSSAACQMTSVFQVMVKAAQEAQDYMPEGGIKILPIILEQVDVYKHFYELDRLRPMKLYDAYEGPRAINMLIRAWSKEWQRRTNANDWSFEGKDPKANWTKP